MRTRTRLAAAALALALLACAARVDREHFAKIATDMPEAEVFAILGEPTDTSSFSLGGLSATSATWVGRDGTITIQFVNGRVKLKTFTTEPDRGPE
jgi:hypothetical protein